MVVKRDLGIGVLVGLINSTVSNKPILTKTNLALACINLLSFGLINKKNTQSYISYNTKTFLIANLCTTTLGIVGKHLCKDVVESVFELFDSKIQRSDWITKAVWNILKIIFLHER